MTAEPQIQRVACLHAKGCGLGYRGWLKNENATELETQPHFVETVCAAGLRVAVNAVQVFEGRQQSFRGGLFSRSEPDAGIIVFFVR